MRNNTYALNTNDSPKSERGCEKTKKTTKRFVNSCFESVMVTPEMLRRKSTCILPFPWRVVGESHSVVPPSVKAFPRRTEKRPLILHQTRVLSCHLSRENALHTKHAGHIGWVCAASEVALSAAVLLVVFLAKKSVLTSVQFLLLRTIAAEERVPRCHELTK